MLSWSDIRKLGRKLRNDLVMKIVSIAESN